MASDDPAAMASALALYAGDPDRCRRQGASALTAIDSRFRMEVMVNSYTKVYDDLLAAMGAARVDRRHA